MLRAIRWAGPGMQWVVEELPDTEWEEVLEQAARDFHDPYREPTPPWLPPPSARRKR